MVDVEQVKAAAAGRCREIVLALCPEVEASILDTKHHPCPRCGGTDRFRAFDDFDQTGGVLCNRCHAEKNGDIIATIMWLRGDTFPQALERLATHLKIDAGGNGRFSQGKKAKTNGRSGANNNAAVAQRADRDTTQATGFDLEAFVHISSMQGEAFEEHFARFAASRPPITTKAIREGGGIFVCSRSFPKPANLTGIAWLGRLTPGGRPRGGIIVQADGKPWPPTKSRKTAEKILCFPKSKCGFLFGGAALKTAEHVLIVEGLGDWLATLSKGVPDDTAVITTTHGAGKWPTTRGRTPYTKPFAGKKVCICGDCDEPGQAGMQKFAKILAGIAAEVYTITLPFEITESGGRDLRDFFCDEESRTVDDLLALAEPFDAGAAGGANDAHAIDDDDNANGRGESPPIANFELITVENEEGEKEKQKDPFPMSMILDDIRTRTDGWPRRVGSALFVHEDNDIAWLPNTPSLMGYLGSKTGTPPMFARGPGFHSQAEVFAELQRTATEYTSVEILPHHPLIPGLYYACPTPTPGDGALLRELVERYCPETPIDGDLILVAFISPAWGSPGDRPLFCISSRDGRGSGKTTLARHIGQVWGGRVEIAADEHVEIVKQRLLSPEGISKRVAVIDNLKSMRFSSAGLEALVTADIISGKRLYVGEDSRPNNLTWILTLNGVSFATDLAQRSVIIKLKRPPHSGKWKDEIEEFIRDNQKRLIADAIGILQRPADYEFAQYSRWSTWERDVLSKLPDPAEAQATILDRQREADAEGEESADFEDFVRNKLREAHYSPDTDIVFLPSRLLRGWLSEVMAERLSATKAGRIINQRIEEGTLRRIQKSTRNDQGRGFLWVGENARPDAEVQWANETRLQFA